MSSKKEKVITWILASLILFLLFYSNMNSISYENDINQDVQEINLKNEINVDSILNAVLDSIRLDSITIKQADSGKVIND